MTASTDFVHLHTHSCYSMLDGLITVPELVAKAKREGMKALALTDHGNMFGAIEFYETCLAHGVKPIIGCEVYVAPGDRRVKEKSVDEEAYHHLVLLAQDQRGYRNLMEIVTDSWLEGFYYKPRTDLSVLAERSAGLIALSACLGGVVPSRLRQGDVVGAEEAALELRSIFPDAFYLELQVNGLEEQVRVNEGLVQLGRRLGIPLVATNDIHFLERDDYEAHTVLMAVNRKMTLEEVKASPSMRFTPEAYFKTAAEMERDFAVWPEALRNTAVIAARCHLELDLNTQHFPKFEVPEGETLESYFERRVWEGLRERYPRLSEEVRRRAEMEIEVIKRMNFAGYFLIVWDFVRFARERNIPIGPGRGSAAGSLVAYALRITDIDPIRHGLLFERFLNPERRSMPDIDLDFADDRREEVMEYIRTKYGASSVAQIVTYNTMGARTAVRDVARAFGLSPAEGDALARLVPEGKTFDKALQESPKFRQEMEATPERRRIFGLARKLEYTLRQYGKHAAGILIADRDVREYVPLCVDREDNIVSQYDKNSVEKVGLIKIDILGLVTLSVIRDAVAEVERTEGKRIDVDALPYDDAKTFHLLQRGRTVGVFQLEKPGFTNTLIRLKPTTLDDIGALLALYRPGPIQSGFVEDYIRRKHGLEKPVHLHPKFEEVLAETYGVMLYQEQVMQLARVMGGFSLAQADIIRKAMGKKDPEVMRQQTEKLRQAALERGFGPEVVDRTIDQIQRFAEYAFNKSHSVAYAHVAWRTAWLKAHYPAEFMASLLTHEMGVQESLVKNINECRALKIKVTRPDINETQDRFVVRRDGQGPKAKKEIVFCLAAVKGVGVKAVASVVAERERNGPFRDFLDFCRRVDLRLVNKRVLEALVKVGAFDSLEPNRGKLFAHIDEAMAYANLLRGQEVSGQMQLFSSPVEFRWREVPDWEEAERLRYERELLGFYVSSHPLQKYAEVLERSRLDRTPALSEMPEGTRVRLAGMVTKVRTESVKDRWTKVLFDLEDYEGSVTVEFWESELKDQVRDLREHALVQVEGTVQCFSNQVRVKGGRLVFMESFGDGTVAAVHIRVRVVGLEVRTLEELKRELEENRGEAAVYIHFYEPTSDHRLGERESRVLRVNGNLRVRPTKRLRGFLAGRFGEDSYWYELKG